MCRMYYIGPLICVLRQIFYFIYSYVNTVNTNRPNDRLTEQASDISPIFLTELLLQLRIMRTQMVFIDDICHTACWPAAKLNLFKTRRKLFSGHNSICTIEVIFKNFKEMEAYYYFL